MLSGNEIIKQHAKGNIIIEPFNKDQINPNSYNITLANKLKVYTCEILDCKTNNPYKEITIPEEGLVLQPGELYIGATNEYTETYGFVPKLIGRSSTGRLGIFIHVTSGFGDNGFKGNWTLGITVVKPVRIYPNMKIGQIYYEPIDGETADEYNGRYQNQQGGETSKHYKG